jgi:HEXXH motif-containing protein
VRPLDLTIDEFTSIASGLGSEAAIAALVAGRLAKRRLLVLGVVREARARGLAVDDAVELLAGVHARAPAALDEVLAHPQIDAWAGDFARTHAVGYLHALAAAAAVRAGMPFKLDVPAAAGAVTLPGIGLISATGEPAALAFDGRALTTGGAPAPVRRPRVVDLADLGGPTVTIDDVDQYRAQYRSPTGDLPDPDRFAALWRDAWRLLAADHPAHAHATRMLLRSFVPLTAAPDAGAERSASSARAGGAIAIAPPRSATSMALLVLHETQHLKLAALLDLVDLDTGPGRAGYHAPWRGDPRPLRGLLHGTYAHLGVADFWRRRDPRQFAFWRAQTRRAATTLANSGELTEVGARFVAEMRATLDRWSDEPVPAADLRIADVCGRVNDVRWQLAHRTTPTDLLAELVTAWQNGSARPPLDSDSPGRGVAGAAREGAAVEARILAAIRTDRPGLPDGDQALLAGAEHAGAESYARQIAARPTDDDWAGLVVALGGLPHPEVARDLHAALTAAPDPHADRDGHAALVAGPDPRDVVRWCRAG